MSKIYKINNHLMEYNNNCIDAIGARQLPTGIQIGSQIWESSNLSYDDGGEGITIRNVTANGVNFGTQYYYTWDAAVRVANKIPGWHLPTQVDWNILVSYAGGDTAAKKKLISTTGWDNGYNGTDDYGFSVIPVGRLWNNDMDGRGGAAYFWTSQVYNSAQAYYRSFTNVGPVYYNYTNKNWAYSIRLVKD